MPVVGELATLITAHTEPFERGTKRAKDKTREFSREVERTSGTLRNRMGPAVGKLTTMLAGPLGLTAGFAGAVSAGKRFASTLLEQSKTLDQIGKLSTRTGMAARDLQALEFIGGQTGVTWTQMTKALQAFNKRTGEAARGMGEAQKAFEYLGIDAKQFATLPLAERFAMIADRIANMRDETEQASVAAQLFSDVGKGPLLNTLRLGGQGIEDLTQTAKDLGIVLDDEVIKSLERTNDAIDRVQRYQEGWKRQLTAELVPALGAAIEEIERFKDAMGVGGGDDSRSTARKVLDSTKWLGGGGAGVLGGYLLDKGDQIKQEERAKLLNEQFRKRGVNPEDNRKFQQQAVDEQKKTNSILASMAQAAGRQVRVVPYF